MSLYLILLIFMISLDNTKYNWNNENITIYQYCQTKNINLPCFCYHEKLSIAGNCRMCLVEVNGALSISCAMPLADRMYIVTNSQRLLHSRESVLEFLLVNHPLDCPICDQGGECDLQDVTLTFGMDRGRYYSEKRSVDNLNCFGPLIKTMMTRCIHCTRCVRFLNEYTDTFDLGVLGRGNSMEIGTYIELNITDELSANIIDLCPVGALTSMPYTFTVRPWELKSIESIDVLDSLASSIRIDVANNTVARITPVLMESINEDWITNKARFSFDALSIQRLHYPSINVNGNWIKCSWIKALNLTLSSLTKISYDRVFGVCGKYTDLETAQNLKEFFNSIGSGDLAYEDSYGICNDFRFSYLLNQTIEGIELASIVILINSNLRLENPLLNSRLRKNYKKSKLPVYSFGNALDYTTFPITNLGNSTKTLFLFMQGKHYHFSKLMFNDKKFSSLAFMNCFIPYHTRPLILLGGGVTARYDGSYVIWAVINFAKRITKTNPNKTTKVYNMTPNHLGFISCNELGFRSHSKITTRKPTFVYYCGVDKIDKNNHFSVFQGYHLPENSQYLNVYLPVTTYFEHACLYMNIEGRLRKTKIAISSPKLVLTNVEVLKLLKIMKRKKYKHNFSVIPNFNKTMKLLNPPINYNHSISDYKKNPTIEYRIDLIPSKKPTPLNASNSVLVRYNIGYYSEDQICKHSRIMCLMTARINFSSFSKSLKFPK